MARLGETPVPRNPRDGRACPIAAASTRQARNAVHTPPVDSPEEPLAGGRMTGGIVRRGDRVYRPMGSWSPAVHEFLRHLESAGFAGAPRVLGVQDGREILTYLAGDVAVDPQWQPGRGSLLPAYARTERALTGAARLLRRLRLFVDAYGLADRRAILPALQRAKLMEVERVGYAPVGPAGAAMSLEWVAGQLRWLEAAIPDLRSCL